MENIHSEETLKTRPWLNADDTHKNSGCVFYMSKPKSARINCVIKGLISREYCTLECTHRNIK